MLSALTFQSVSDASGCGAWLSGQGSVIGRRVEQGQRRSTRQVLAGSMSVPRVSRAHEERGTYSNLALQGVLDTGMRPASRRHGRGLGSVKAR